MGDKYTPTTARVRDSYVRYQRNAFIASTGEHMAEFDRWLNEYTASVLESARNRLNGHDPAGEQLQRMADEKREGGR